MSENLVPVVGILQSKDTQSLDEVWLDDAQQSGIYAVQRFARTLEQWPDRRTNQPAENAQTRNYRSL
jgi:hypothetical protein